MFSFLACLVDLKVFEEVTIDYLIVGHTGNEVDQLFSILANELKSEILTIEDLEEKMLAAPIVPKPVVSSLEYIFDWKSFIEDKLSKPALKNQSKYNSFLFSSEDGDVKFRGKRLPQDGVLSLYPPAGIRLVRKDINYEAVGAADFRVEDLKFDAIWKGLSAAMPHLSNTDKKRVTKSWDNLRSRLENLPRQKNTLPTMKISDLPKQKHVVPLVPDHLMQEEAVSELTGDRYPEVVEDADFDTATDKLGMDVVVYTDVVDSRPWVGRIIQLLDRNRFKIHWYSRKNSRGKTFYALTEKNGEPMTDVVDNESVMIWRLSEKRTENSFELSTNDQAESKKQYERLDKAQKNKEQNKEQNSKIKEPYLGRNDVSAADKSNGMQNKILSQAELERMVNDPTM